MVNNNQSAKTPPDSRPTYMQYILSLFQDTTPSIISRARPSIPCKNPTLNKAGKKNKKNTPEGPGVEYHSRLPLVYVTCTPQHVPQKRTPTTIAGVICHRNKGHSRTGTGSIDHPSVPLRLAVVCSGQELVPSHPIVFLEGRTESRPISSRPVEIRTRSVPPHRPVVPS